VAGAQPVGGQVLQPQLLPAGHRLTPLAQVVKLWTLEKPVRVDILILSASGDRLLPRPTPIFHIVAMQSDFVVLVHQLHNTSTCHLLSLGSNQAGEKKE